MAGSDHRPDHRTGNGTAEVARRGARTAGEAIRQEAKSGAEAAGQAGKATAAAVSEGGEPAAEAARAARQVVAELARSSAEATHRTADAQAELVRRAGEQGAETMRQAGGSATEARMPGLGLWAGPQEMWRMMPQPGAVPGGLPGLPQAFAGFMGEMMRANLQITQELFRLANPAALIEMQQQLVRGYLDAIVAGQAGLLGAARRTSEDALRQAGQAPGRKA